MIKRILSLLSVGLGLLSCDNGHTVKEKPNIIYIIADDLGYAELGSYGQEIIETPNLDTLAARGMRFTQHYSGAPVCAPARASLMTGKHMGHCYVRGNDEWSERGDVWNYRAQAADPGLEGQRPIPGYTRTIGSVMQEAGYKTAAIGKWGLGAPGSQGTPNNVGFDFFYGYNCQRQAHTYFPLHLYKNEDRVYLNNDTIAPHTRLAKGADPMKEESYADYWLSEYSPDLMYDEMIGFVEENKAEPFFLYWATPIPHVPIQAPPRWVDYYNKKFGDEQPYLGQNSYYPHRYPRAGYAAMVSYMDEQVGKLITYLKENDLYDNTLIIFTSDNGPTFNGGTASEWFDSAKPFASNYGKGKGFLYEGGIRVPMIASWPGKIAEGSVSHHISAFWDVMPTLCEVSGSALPEDSDGISYLPTLLGAEQKAHDELYWEYPEYGGQVAVRKGKWKAICTNLFKGNTTFELYDLEADPTESSNVAEQHPEVVDALLKTAREEHIPSWNQRWQLKFFEDGMAKH